MKKDRTAGEQAIADVAAQWKIEVWPIDRFRPYARNPRKNDEAVDRMVASIREFGFKVPMLVRSDGEIVDGHLRLKGAIKCELQALPVILCDEWTDAQVKAFRILANRSVAWAEWDNQLLGAEFLELKDMDFDLGLTGFDLTEVDGLMATFESTPEGETDEDAAPEIPKEPVTVLGDLWVCGRHRVLCGDSTSVDATARLVGEKKADLVFTDPPYNVDYEGYTEEKLKIQGDKMSPDAFREFLEGAFRSLLTVVKSTASLYVCHASSCQREFQNALEASGFEVRCQIIWAKNTFAWGFGRYKFQHEPIFYAHVAGESDDWYGDKSQSTLWEEKKPAANRLHPTMKPIELIERALVNSSKAGEVVLDPFGGSGSTLIACEKNARDCRTLELDPKYVDVIVKRWQDFTGKKAVLDGDGRTFDELKAWRVGVSTEGVPA